MKNVTFKTRHALVLSCISLMTCFAMLLGTTFAWFTDSVTSGVNRIVAGNLDVELYHKNTNTTTVDLGDKVDNVTTLFNAAADDNTILWEPGAMAYETFTVKNLGSLALKYQLAITQSGFNTVMEPGETATDTGRSLLDTILVAVTSNTISNRDEGALLFTNAGLNNTTPTCWTLKQFITNGVIDSTMGAILPATATSHGAGEVIGEDTFTVVLYWPSDTEGINTAIKDNDYNLQNGKYASDATAETVGQLWVDLGVTLVATQYTEENDSFDDQYDKTATITIASSAPATTSVSQPTVLTAAAAPSNPNATNTTTVTIPAGATSTDTASTVAADKTVYIEVNTENKFAVSSDTEAATVGIDLYVGATKTDSTNNTLSSGYYTVSTYITPGLTNVGLSYSDGTTTENWTAHSGEFTADKQFTYNADDGHLVFTTKHFSDFNVTGEAVAYNATKDQAYNQTGELTTNQAVLKNAIESAVAGDTIKLMKDVTLGAWDSNNNVSININKNLTLDGAGHTVRSTAGRGIWVSESNVTLNVRNMSLVGEAGFERGIQINGSKTNVTLNIEKVTTESTMYAINVCDGATCNINISDSDITGWGALNLWAGGYIVNVTNSTLSGINDKGYNAEGWNDFGTVILEGDTTHATEMHSSNNTVNLTNCTINASQTTGNHQWLILYNDGAENNVVNLTNCTLNKAEGTSETYLDQGTGSSLIIDGVQQIVATPNIE